MISSRKKHKSSYMFINQNLEIQEKQSPTSIEQLFNQESDNESGIERVRKSPKKGKHVLEAVDICPVEAAGRRKLKHQHTLISLPITTTDVHCLDEDEEESELINLTAKLELGLRVNGEEQSTDRPSVSIENMEHMGRTVLFRPI